MSKAEIRNRIAQLREGLTREEHDAGALRLLTKAQPYLDGADTVLVYSALDHELSLQPVIDALWSRGVRVVFPKVTADRELTLFQVDGAGELAVGSYGILEPRNTGFQVDPREVDLAFIPGVAFTRSGARLGYGGGYYDTLLTQLREDCQTIGVGFTFQLLDSLPIESHDLPVTKVLTV